MEGRYTYELGRKEGFKKKLLKYRAAVIDKGGEG